MEDEKELSRGLKPGRDETWVQKMTITNQSVPSLPGGSSPLRLPLCALSLLGISLSSGFTYAGILAGPVTNQANGHIYFLLSSNSWSGAEADARSLGGHLVTINDAAENDWVYNNFSTFGNIQRPLWIGLYQPAGADEPAAGWSWISREPVVYTNWTPGEPNNNPGNNQGPQNWAMIWPPSAGGIVAPYSTAHWNDYWNTNRIVDPSLASLHWGVYGVVEISTPPTRLSIIPESGALRLAWSSQANAVYQVQYRSDPGGGGWTDFGSVIPGTGTTNSLWDYPINDYRFYRVFPYP